MIDPEQLMQLAIDRAREGMAKGQTPFGCAIAQDDRVLVTCHNTVLATTDITAHAEINAVREACRIVADVHLEGCDVATTCEPCPMCMAALHWARVRTVYFGATIADAAAAGFNELQVPAAHVLHIGGSRVKLIGGILTDDCKSLFDDWRRLPAHRTY